MLSVVVGLLLALMRMSKPPVSWIAATYVNVFRGVPALVSVIWVYFGLSLRARGRVQQSSRRA